MTDRLPLTTALAPAPLSSFSAGVRAGNIVQVAGQGPLDAGSGTVLHPDDVGAQTTATLERVRDILRSGGADVSDLIMLRVYLTDRSHFAPMNSAYEEFMATHLGDGVPPARTTVMVGLPLDEMLVEIDALAVLTDDQSSNHTAESQEIPDRIGEAR
ncbi:RidA family protein [Ruania zhangjianzhongii]|uniref:RidA family protein n=1 Tax=Ruania zhangjianzhongii TaxID=2603206 RepID=UPI0011C9478F|nr:RidA family protein [Ruania zhangjianzhongii]